MEYRVVIVESEEGYSVSCPSLKGCHSQGRTRQEALDNIRIAIQEWLEATESHQLTGIIYDDKSISA